MNNTVRVEEKEFSLEDVVTYSNIEITHANDNKAPCRKIIGKIIFWGCVLALCAILVFY